MRGYKNGRFYLTDFSNNGTFIELADGTRTLVRNSNYRLILAGCLYFGEEPGPEAETAVQYRLAADWSQRAETAVSDRREDATIESVGLGGRALGDENAGTADEQCAEQA